MRCPECDEEVRMVWKCHVCGGRCCAECARDHYCSDDDDITELEDE